MREINQDILNINIGVIIHSVNCKRTWGAGLAKKMKSHYPTAFNDYLNNTPTEKSWELLGSIVHTKVKDLHVISAYTQYDVSVTHRKTEYCAVIECFKSIRDYLKINRIDLPIYIPHGIGCGLGGGDWNIVSNIISNYLPKAIICKI